MANGKFLIGKPSGGVTTVTITDGATNTNLVLPESGTVSGVTTAVTDNAIPRFDGTTGKLQNSGVTIDDSNHIGIGAVSASTFVTANINDTRLANSGQYGINNNLVVNPETLTAHRNYFGIASVLNCSFANTTAYVPSVYGSYNIGTISSGSNSTTNDGTVYGSLNQGSANNTLDVSNKYIQTVIGTKGAAYINIAGYNNVSNMYGVYAEVSSGGTLANGSGVSNAYGVYIGNPISTEAVTNNYGLYQATAGVQNVFKGDVLFDSGITNQTLTVDTVNSILTSTYNDTTNIYSCQFGPSDTIGCSKTPSGGGASVSSALTSSGLRLPNVNSTNTGILDWYEEGTFTPAIEGTTTAGVAGFSNRGGKYTRVGNTCHFELYMVVTSHTGSGNMRVTGLPFTSTYGYSLPISITAVNLTFPNSNLIAYIEPAASTILLASMITGGTNTGIPIDTSFILYLAGSYPCA